MSIAACGTVKTLVVSPCYQQPPMLSEPFRQYHGPRRCTLDKRMFTPSSAERHRLPPPSTQTVLRCTTDLVIAAHDNNMPLVRTCSVALDTPPGKTCRSAHPIQSCSSRMHLCLFPVLRRCGPGPLRLHLRRACLRPFRDYTRWSRHISAPFPSYSTSVWEPPKGVNARRNIAPATTLTSEHVIRPTLPSLASR